MNLAELAGLAIAGLSVDDIALATPLKGGGNNRVYKLELRDGTVRVLKFYFRHPGDARDRLQAEFGALTFLWGEGVRCIPEPFGVDRERGAALYGFIEGAAFSGVVTPGDLDQALHFVLRLRALAKSPRAAILGAASEAFFTWAEVRASIDRRMDRLRAAAGEDGPLKDALAAFLTSGLEPLRTDLFHWIDQRAARAVRSATAALPPEKRTLSPSDFGFHNAIKDLAGNWVFQDFEYFGWDDPSKLIVDFMLHPAMNLGRDLQAHVCRGMLEIFGDDADLRQRLAIAYPLYGLKWCMILLNEFVPESSARRRFAAGPQSAEDLRSSQLRQLKKAEHMVKVVRSSYGEFASSLDRSVNDKT